MGDALPEAVLIQKELSDKDSQEKMDLVTKNLPLFAEKIVLPENDTAAKSEGIHFCVFHDESQLKVLMDLIDKELSEPYSIYTYRYFVYNWPDLCFFALDGDRYVGVIVCKLEATRDGYLQGYIAMLAVDAEYRKRGIGRALSEMAIDAMAIRDAAMIVLETELSNKPALALYQSLGFIRERRFLRYYLNGMDAFHLKLMLHDFIDSSLNEV